MANGKPEAVPSVGEAKPKKERKKREARPIEVPDLETFKDPTSKAQFAKVLANSKSLVGAIQEAKAVQIGYLKEVRRAVNAAIMDHFKTLTVDPVAKKRARLETAIAKAQAKLDELQ